jgi:hypothetical protein
MTGETVALACDAAGLKYEDLLPTAVARAEEFNGCLR